MTAKRAERLPPPNRTACDEPQALAYYRTHGRRGGLEFVAPGLASRLAAAIVRLAARELDAPAASLHIVHGGVIRSIARVTIDGDSPLAPTPIAAAEPLAGSLDAEVVATGAPLAVADSAERRERLPIRRAGALLGVPVAAAAGEVVGVLWVGDHRTRAWSRTSIDRLRALARELAGALPADAGIREAALSWQAELLHTLTAESPIGLYAVDERDGSVLAHNRCFLEIFGLEEIAARFDGCDITHGEVLARVAARMAQPGAMRRAVARLSDPANRRVTDTGVSLADGRHVQVFSAQIRDGGDAYLGRCWLVEDVTTHRRAAEDALRRRRVLDAVVDASPLAITVTDRDGRITLWNPAAERLFGWPAAAVVGGPNPALAQAHGSDGRSARDGAGAGETIVRTRDGAVRVVRAAKAALASDPGAESHTLTIFSDVTAQRELEDRLHQAQRLEAVGRFAGGLAHDFNNVLAIVLSTAEVALADIPPRTQLWRDLDTIRLAARHGAGLTRQLLAFGRNEPIARGPLHLAALVTQTLPMVRRLLPADIMLSVVDESDGAQIWADASEVQQIVLNLTANARDAMPEGGTISVATGVVRVPDDQRPPQVPPGRYVTLSVHDGGTGIPPHVREHLFEPLFTTKAAGAGTGLGLATVHAIVLQSQGHIAVESEPGSTRFTIFWPILSL